MEMLPEVVLLGPIPIAIGAITAVLGGLAAYLLAGWVRRRDGDGPGAAQDAIVNLLLGGVLGAKLLYFALDPLGHLTNPLLLLVFPYGPLAVPAGVVGGVLALSWSAWAKRGGLRLLDQIALPLLVGTAIAALGWRWPGGWAYAPFLGSAAVAAWGPAFGAWTPVGGAALPERPSPQRAPLPGDRLYSAVILACLGIVVADFFRPAAGLMGGITLTQLAAAITGSALWLWHGWTRRGETA
jgi:hypothetical protein